MSDELGQGNSLLETNSFAVSNSDNSGGSDDKKGKKPLISSSNSPTPTTTPTPATTPSTPAGGPKRGRNGIAKNKKGGGGDGEGGEGGGQSDHDDVHIWTERERRKRMRNMFSNLHALLPQLPPKADKSTIVDEAVSYIKTLQNTLKNLQKQKLERLRRAGTIGFEPTVVAPNMLTYNSSSREAYLADQVSSMNLGMTASSGNSLPVVPSFPICFGTWSSPNVVLSVFGEDAHISVCVPKKLGFFTTIAYVLEKHRIDVVTAQLSSNNFRNVYMIHAHASGVSEHFRQVLPVEEIFKLAVGEIMFWMST
ncbi:hypothetical protein AQUCO_00700701v1 [Aquilegia coerulea]|uniref:BHLH domain-containing protein n=1 Tax=Aquilegia coerulea TaxID=218851 RepID=A0A2G5ELA3_AQUCA|nr:hypothetical protein AQUCO_00700701v1 [Aquilegia coerulea]